MLMQIHYYFDINFAELHFTCLCLVGLLASPQLFFFLPGIFKEISEFFVFISTGLSRLIIEDYIL
jgi:hypothetical protein